jgi:Flp pilus assembly protein TadG
MKASLGEGKRQEGAAAVEFAIILPLLVVLVFGIIEFGLLLYNQQVITNASREGARAGIVQDTPRVPLAAIQGVVQTYTSTHLVTFTSGVVNAQTDLLDPAGNVNNGRICTAFGDDLIVRVRYPYTFLVFSNAIRLVAPSTLGPTLTLTAQTVMRCE